MNKLQPLSDVSNIPINEIEGLFAQVKENQLRLRGCVRHAFGLVVWPGNFNRTAVCAACGGKMSISDIRLYAAGYVAHGGAESDVWTLTTNEDNP